MLRLRAHHLLCMLTYVGKGYTPAFIANYDTAMARLNAGESILLVDGPDELCAPMLGETDHHCLTARIAGRDQRAAQALSALLGRPIESGVRLVPDAALLEQLRADFALGTIRAGCTGCGWAPFCSTIAEEGYQAAKLQLAVNFSSNA